MEQIQDNHIRHIALISTSFPESYDGSEAAGSFVSDFAEVLSRQVKVTIIAPGRQTRQQTIHASLEIVTFAVPFLPLSLLKPSNPKNWAAIIKTLSRGQAAVNSVVKSNAIDYLFALWSLPSGYWAMSTGRKNQLNYATWSLGSDIWSLGKIPIVKQVLKTVLQASHLNFADGYELGESVKNISQTSCHFLPSSRSLTIPREKTLKSSGPYRIAFLGRWHPNKGADILIEALSHLSASAWEQIEQLKFCGGGPLEEQIQQGIEYLQQQSKPVELDGYLTKEQAIELFLWADYVLIPSRIESIPVVFSDAMQCLSPIACMPVGDLPQLIRHYNVGQLSAAVNAEDFAKAIEQLLATPPIQYQSQLLEAAKDFDIEQAVNRFLTQIHS